MLCGISRRGVSVFFKRRADKVAALRRVPLLSGLSQRHLNMIANHAVEVKIKADKIMEGQGLQQSSLKHQLLCS